jgi:hypothetical protein
LPTIWVRTIALVAFRRTTGGVVPSDRLVSLSDVVVTDGVGAGHRLTTVNQACSSCRPLITHHR